jgi:hypothetical protein
MSYLQPVHVRDVVYYLVKQAKINLLRYRELPLSLLDSVH